MTENDEIIKLIEEYLLTYKDIFIDELVNEDFNEFEKILNSEKKDFDKKYVLIDKKKIINKEDKEEYYDSFMKQMKKKDKSIKDKFIKYLLEIFFEIFQEAPYYYIDPNNHKLYNKLVEKNNLILGKNEEPQVGGKTRKSKKPRKQVRKSRKSKNPRKQVRKSRKSRKQVRKSRKSRKQVRRNRK